MLTISLELRGGVDGARPGSPSEKTFVKGVVDRSSATLTLP